MLLFELVLEDLDMESVKPPMTKRFGTTSEREIEAVVIESQN